MRIDRHGRGVREIYSTATFDADLHDAVDKVKAVWGAALRGVEFASDEIPDLENIRELGVGWDGAAEQVPLGALDGRRITVYRLPILLRATTPAESARMIFDTVVEQVAELLGMDPSDVHDEYGYEE